MTPAERLNARESWIAEFYPKPAEESDNSDLQALAHSLQKWIGLRKENLEKHGWHDAYATPVGEGSGTCALCQRHLYEDDSPMECINCPLYKQREAKCYNTSTLPGDWESPYQVFRSIRNPEPMISLIQICFDKEKERLGIK